MNYQTADLQNLLDAANNIAADAKSTFGKLTASQLKLEAVAGPFQVEPQKGTKLRHKKHKNGS
jgi:hypothetical protein